MKGLYELLRALKRVPFSELRTVLYAQLLSDKKTTPARSHYITSDGYILCTNSGRRYTVKE